MISVILQCQNQEVELARSLSALVAGAVEGLVSDVTGLDSGSDDDTMKEFVARAKTGASLADIAKGVKTIQLKCEIVPASYANA